MQSETIYKLRLCEKVQMWMFNLVITILHMHNVCSLKMKCPCHDSINTLILYHGSNCYVTHTNGAGLVNWTQAINGQKDSLDDCMQNYALAAIHDAHLRLTVAHKIKQLLPNKYGIRLRVALATEDESDWIWLREYGMNITANQSNIVLWKGEGSTLTHENHSSAVLDLDSGQFLTADIHELLPALWQIKPASWSQSRFTCHNDVQGSSINPDHDIVSSFSETSEVFCERECHKVQCTAYTLAPGSDALLSCILHFGYSSSLVSLQLMTGATFCIKKHTLYDNYCAPLDLGENSVVSYSSKTNPNVGRYDSTTTAMIACLNGTYFPHNKETKVETACGANGQWLFWDSAMYICKKLTKVWLFDTYYLQWQEWQPGANSITVPQGTDIRSTSHAVKIDNGVAYYRGNVYLIQAALGYAYKISPNYSVTTLPDIAVTYRRYYPGAVQIPGGRVLFCGGQLSGAGVSSCFVYHLETGLTQWTPSLIGAVRWANALCYYRHRVYAVAGWNGGYITCTPNLPALKASKMERDEFWMNAACRTYHDKLYLAGGCYYNGGRRSQVEVFDGVSWSLLGYLPRAVCCGSLSIIDDNLYYAAGHIHTVGNWRRISIYNVTTNTWTDIPDLVTTGVHHQCAIEIW